MELRAFDYPSAATHIKTQASDVSASVTGSNSVMGLKYTVGNVLDMVHDFRELGRLRDEKVGIKYRKAVAMQQEQIRTNFSLYQLENGIVGTSAFSYAFARDNRNGNINIFWAQDEKCLESKVNKDGLREFIHDDGRYHCATLPADCTIADIEREVRNHHMDARDFGIHTMSVQGGDFTSLHKSKTREGKRSLKVYGFTNDHFALSVHQNPREKGGGWTLKVSDPYERPENEPAYTEIDSMNSNSELMTAFLSNGHQIGIYKKKEEALAQMHMIINQQTQMVWRAEDPSNIRRSDKFSLLDKINKLSTTGFNFFRKEAKNPENVQDAGFDVALTLAKAAAARAIFVLSLPIAIVLTVGGGFLTRKGLSLYKSGMAEYKYWRHGASAKVGLAADAVEQSRQNLKREVNRKHDPETNKHMHVLDGSELDITKDDEKQLRSGPKQKTPLEIISVDSQAYAKMNTPLSPNSSAEIPFNGLARFSYKDKKTGAKVTFAKYIPVADINRKISISDEAKKLLDTGRIMKFTNKDGIKTTEVKEVTFKQMAREIQRKVYSEDDSYTEAERRRSEKSISWLFNNSVHEKDEIEEELDEDKEIQPMGIVSATEKLAAMRTLFGSDKVELEKPTPELVEFWRGSELPAQAPLLNEPATIVNLNNLPSNSP